MATKSKEQAVELEDAYASLFAEQIGAWTEQDEDAQIAALAADTKIKYIIVEHSKFVGRFPDGTIVVAPLRVPFGVLLDAIENDDPMDQFTALMHAIGDEGTLDALRAGDSLSAADYIQKYFAVFAKAQQASMGE